MKSLLAALALCLTVVVLPAQRNPQPHFRNYSTEHGLPSPEVYCAFQDSRGYMWFGTDNGVARFDGYAFRTYDALDGLTSNVVFDIYEDAKGWMWFGTMTGETFLLEQDTIVPYRYNHLVLQRRKQYHGVKLAYLQPEDETAYFELNELGLLRIDSAGRDSLITSESALSRLFVALEGVPRHFFTAVYRRAEQEKIDQYYTEYEVAQEVIRFELLSKAGRSFIDLPASARYNTIRNIQTRQLTTGQLLIHCDQHLYCIEEGRLLWVVPYGISPEFKINQIFEADDGTLLLCMSEGGGLRRYRDVEAIRRGVFDAYLQGLSVSSVFQDAEGGLWVPSQEQGVFYCHNRQLLIYDTRFGFSDDFVSAVTFRNEHEWYAGCRNGDIFRVNTATNRITEKLTAYYGYHNHDLLYQPTGNRLWSNGTYWKNGQWNFVNWPANKLTGKKAPLLTSKLKKLHVNPAGELLGCDANGFVIIDVANDSMKFNTYVTTTLRERTFALKTDREQRLWVGNARGLFEFRDSALVSPGIDHPAFHMRVEDIDQLPDGRLVFGTKGRGVVCWQGAEVWLLSVAEGLTSNMIEDVHVDDQGTLWVGTLNGLNKVTFDPAGRPKIRRFTVANGLPSNEIYQVRSYKEQVWLCTAKGLVHFHEQPEDTVSVAPVLRGLLVNGDPVELGRAGVFAYGENNLSFQFHTINFRQNGDIPYRYRLQEQEAWSYTRNLSVDYARLHWGKYRFEVQSQNEDGYWSSSTIYPVEIRPPWWATGWFIGLSGLLLLGSGVGFYQYRIAQLKRESRIQQQIGNLERSALQAQMNPHFIFNCLNSIQNFILRNDRKKAVEYLSRFAQLVRHNLNASVAGTVNLEEELGLLDNYLALEQERFEHRFDYTLSVDDRLDPHVVSFPPLLIQPYVENAIIHGLSQKTEKGKVAIHFGSENGSLSVCIRDNGPGFHPDLKQKTNGQYKSVGMTITQKRLELLGANPKQAVHITAITKEDKITGTEVSILIHLNSTL